MLSVHTLQYLTSNFQLLDFNFQILISIKKRSIILQIIVESLKNIHINKRFLNLFILVMENHIFYFLYCALL